MRLTPKHVPTKKERETSSTYPSLEWRTPRWHTTLETNPDHLVSQPPGAWHSHTAASGAATARWALHFLRMPYVRNFPFLGNAIGSSTRAEMPDKHLLVCFPMSLRSGTGRYAHSAHINRERQLPCGRRYRLELFSPRSFAVHWLFYGNGVVGFISLKATPKQHPRLVCWWPSSSRPAGIPETAADCRPQAWEEMSAKQPNSS